MCIYKFLYQSFVLEKQFSFIQLINGHHFSIFCQINRELKKRLRLNANALVIHHRQTGYMDLVTESLLNEYNIFRHLTANISFE